MSVEEAELSDVLSTNMKDENDESEIVENSNEIDNNELVLNENKTEEVEVKEGQEVTLIEEKEEEKEEEKNEKEKDNEEDEDILKQEKTIDNDSSIDFSITDLNITEEATESKKKY